MWQAYYRGTECVELGIFGVDCLQSVFSLKMRLVLISSSAIANHDVIITIEMRREKTDC